jgi:hypothetical protein
MKHDNRLEARMVVVKLDNCIYIYIPSNKKWHPFWKLHLWVHLRWKFWMHWVGQPKCCLHVRGRMRWSCECFNG